MNTRAERSIILVIVILACFFLDSILFSEPWIRDPGVTVPETPGTREASPDLIIAFVDVSDVVTDCQDLEVLGDVTATVENAGAAGTSSDFTVLFFEDHNGNSVYDAGIDYEFGATTVSGGLAAGDLVDVSIPVSGTVLFTDNLMFVYADSDNDVAESDETNNINDSGENCLYIPSPGVFTTEKQWHWTGSSMYPSYNQVMMLPIVANITDDNADSVIDEHDVPDVIFTAFQGSAWTDAGIIRAISGADGSDIFATSPTSTLTAWPSGALAVGDIDADNKPEIVGFHGTTGNRLIAIEHDGTFKFLSAPVPDSISSSNPGGISLADLNGNGTVEIIFSRHIFDNTGLLLASGSSRRGQNSSGPLSTVADIDLDGSPDIVAGFTVYDVVKDPFFNIIGMSLKWEARDAADNIVPGDGYPGVANFDSDDYAEVVVVAYGSVWLFDHDGSHIWGPVSIPGGGLGGPPNIDDFDNDKEPEIGLAGTSRYVVFDTDGSILWNSNIVDASGFTSSSVFDFEADGTAEVVYKDEYNLRIYRGTDGSILAEIPSSSGTRNENPVVADVDNDGNAEIIVCSNDAFWGTTHGIEVFRAADDNWVNTRNIWNQHTYHITNINDDASIPSHEMDNWLIFNNFRSQELFDIHDIFAAPDLTASYIRLNKDYCPDSIGFVARIGNGGANVAGAPVNVAYYDGDPDLGGTLLGVATTSTDIIPGGYEDVTLFISPPLVGAHTICVVADDDGTSTGNVNECDETNNMCCTEFDTYCNRPPVADAGGPYIEECNGQPTQVYLDGTGSSDPDGDPLTYFWTTDCPGGYFDDQTIATPILYLDGPPPCPVECTVTLKVDDGNGANDTDTAVVSVNDTTPPYLTGVPGNATYECDSVPLPASPSAADACDPAPVIDFLETRINGYCEDYYTLTRLWTATDFCTNAFTAAQIITVVDTTPPVLTGVPADVTVECDSVPEAASPSVSDNCDPSPLLDFTETREDGDCLDNYTLTRQWTATDRCDNASTGVQVVTVQDTTPPELTCDFEPVPDDEDLDEYIDGLYRIRYSGTDNCAVEIDLEAFLNVYGTDESCDDEDPEFEGYPVVDGDLVQLICDENVDCWIDDELLDEGIDPVLFINGPGLLLTVIGGDNCDNVSETECTILCFEDEDEGF